MKIVICDITGRTINYNVALCEAIHNELGVDDSVEYWSAGIKDEYPFKTHTFTSIVPKKYRSVAHAITRVLKAFDTIIAYIWILLKLKFTKIDVLHLQWFPFISLGLMGASVDINFLKLISWVSPNTKLVFTIHNLCPHRMTEEGRKNYNPIFTKALGYFDAYVVHTEGTREEVTKILGLPYENTHVIYHGIFKTDGYTFQPSNIDDKQVNLLMYGFQHAYKGTDIFIKSLSYLDNECKKRLKVTVCGAFGLGYLDKCKSIETGVEITWIPDFLPDTYLYDQINKADILLFPYRRISQSGALLLALNTGKYLITSNITTFVETLKGFPKECFFKNEDPEDLARVISMYLNKEINTDKIVLSIKELNKLYSWEMSAQNTILMYKSIIKHNNGN